MIMFPADMSSPSRLDRTPSHSPSRRPDPKRILWTPPAKVITNPRLNQISSPVGMVTINPQSPLNKTPPKKQSIHMQTLSPKISASPTNLKKGIVYTWVQLFFDVVAVRHLSLLLAHLNQIKLNEFSVYQVYQIRWLLTKSQALPLQELQSPYPSHLGVKSPKPQNPGHRLLQSSKVQNSC